MGCFRLSIQERQLQKPIHHLLPCRSSCGSQLGPSSSCNLPSMDLLRCSCRSCILQRKLLPCTNRKLPCPCHQEIRGQQHRHLHKAYLGLFHLYLHVLSPSFPSFLSFLCPCHHLPH